MDNLGTSLTREEKTWGFLCHLTSLSGFIVPFGNIIGPLMVWLLRKDSSSYVDSNGKESLNFQVNLTTFLVGIFLFLPYGIKYKLLAVLGVYGVICVAVATLKSLKGLTFRYPLALRLIR